MCGAMAVPLSAVFASLSLSARDDLASYNWSIHASPNLADDPPPDSVVLNFLHSVVDGLDGADEDLCSFRFVDLKRNGVLSLVLGADVSGRGLCRQFYIVDKDRHGFQIYGLDGEWGQGSDVASSLKDLNNDGKLEILYEDELGSRATSCVPSWTVIYAWTGAGYTNVSARYKEFYRKRLAELKAKLSAHPPPGSAEYGMAECLPVEAARIKKFLGIFSNGDIDRVSQLAKSKDPAKRELAAYELAGIGTPEAQKYLKTLAKDPDDGVSY
ncbi:MAG TPA: HEAT repeat domain-containing protein, partial [Candidatus Binataceae bacterium]|nr:HEAT repeat domain-containing protein [Candidatus Binataceae bacterium]